MHLEAGNRTGDLQLSTPMRLTLRQNRGDGVRPLHGHGRYFPAHSVSKLGHVTHYENVELLEVDGQEGSRLRLAVVALSGKRPRSRDLLVELETVFLTCVKKDRIGILFWKHWFELVQEIQDGHPALGVENDVEVTELGRNVGAGIDF